MPQKAVGIDLVSMLKTIKICCEKSLEAIPKNDFTTVAECFTEIEELLGGYKLPLFAEVMRQRAAETSTSPGS